MAYTKTFSMLFAAGLAVSLVPVLITWFVRGKIPDEIRNPVSRAMIFIYEPLAKIALRFRWTVVVIALALLAATWWPYSQIGSEFMPPLNEGSLLYMPTSTPGMSISEAREVLSKQNRIIKNFPEVERVYGKIGRARTPTDPAPLSMVETTITLKPESEWRKGMTFEKIKKELGAELPYPGMPAIWWMPIQTRIEMLATGIRSQVGIKILGPDLEIIESIGIRIEELLKNAPNTASVFSERVTGGYYVDFEIDRDAIARYGLVVEDVQDVIETAIGGRNIDTIIEGRARFPINVRYARDFRDGFDELKHILVAAPNGTLIPLGQLADIRIDTGPPMVRNENGQLAGFVFVDTYDTDLGAYVSEAKRLIRENIDIPSGYYLEWGGQYQYLLRAKEKLNWIIPLTLVIIFLLLYLNFNNMGDSCIVLLSIPFALVGGFWLIWALDYNFSVAVAVGFIALAGVAAETGVIMIIYIDEAWKSAKQRLSKPKTSDLREAILKGAVQRVRPMIMTVSTTIIGLLPIMLGHGTGADTMKRIAAPMVGGMVSSTILTLLIIPAVYSIWKSKGLDKAQEQVVGRGRKAYRWTLIAVFAIILAGVAGYLYFAKSGSFSTTQADSIIQTVEESGYRIQILGASSNLHIGENVLRVLIRDAATGEVKTAQSIFFGLKMDMPGMQMQAEAQLAPVPNASGEYVGSIRPTMGGEWIARISAVVDGTKIEQAITITVIQ